MNEASYFAARVIEGCRGSVPLGAYADGDAASYLFLAPDGPFALARRFDPETPLQPLSSGLPLFSWDEREMAQERGVRFEMLPDARPLRAQNGVMPPPLVAHGAGVMNFVVGPVHAGIIEPGRFTFSSGGETIVHLDAQLAYAHRGVERRLEGMDALEAAPLVARICGSCSAARSLAYARALEDLAGASVTPPVEAARLAIAELERIYNHLADLAASAAGAGWNAGFTAGMALKERAMRLCSLASGHRLLFEAIVPGGIAANALRNLVAFRAALDELAAGTERYLRGLFAHAPTISRWRQAGIVPRDAAIALGAVGPAHRASRGEIDVRTFAPYGAYRRFVPQIARAAHGDAFARCSVKRDEVRESFRLIRAAAEEIGDVELPDPQTLAVPEGTALAVVEGPRGAETIAVRTRSDGTLARFHAISASYRNWPVVARAMDGNIVPDFPLVNKSFNLCYACADR